MTDIPKSPLTGSNRVELIETIRTGYLIEGYQKTFGIDVKRFFEGLDKLFIYRCLDTNYSFYYPIAGIEGDGKFYENFQKYDWYYMDWKWEHDIALSVLSAGHKVLEIGSGKGSFLDRLQADGFDVSGLELNEDMLEKCQNRGLNVQNENIVNFAEKKAEFYDFVCSFQVMEHIADVKNVLEASVKVLKPGGKLLISVPNNASFIRSIKDNYLNMPPHHAGLWDKKSLSALTELFPIGLDKLYFESLQDLSFLLV